MAFIRPDILRPPSEGPSYFLPLTKGCSNNTCAFCGFYGAKLQVRDISEVKREIDAVAMFLKTGVVDAGIPEIAYEVASGWDGQRVFLQDGDALVYPHARMKEVLEYISLRMPRVSRIASYATAQDILRRSVAELAELKERKLDILYLGLESGDDEVLKKIRKGSTTSQMIEAAARVKQAGIKLSVTVILGMAGPAGSEKHVKETARVLSEMDPDYVGALTLTLVPGTPLYEEHAEGRFELITPFESLRELTGIIRLSNFTDCFFTSMHASNYLSVRARLPQERDRVVARLESVIEANNPSMLRPEFLRGL